MKEHHMILIFRSRPVRRIEAFLVSLALAAAIMPHETRAQNARGAGTGIRGTEGCSSLTSDRNGNFYFMAGGDVRMIHTAATGMTDVARVVKVPPDMKFGGQIAADAAGNLYFAQMFDHLVQKLAVHKLSRDTLTTVAGRPEKFRGERGIPGDATKAFVLSPRVLAFDSSGNLYIGETADTSLDILKLSTTGHIEFVNRDPFTPAANRGGGPVDRIPDNEKPVTPSGLAVNPKGELYVSDNLHSVVWKLAAGVLTRVAGNGRPGNGGDNGPATSASLSGPSGIAFDAQGNLYVADTANNRVRRVSTSGTITTVPGGAGTRADLMDVPESLGFDRQGNLYVCGGNLRMITSP